jgi:Na+/melibiose symporter-like transporter
VAKGVIDYEMLDYVEWKTGERSEGVTMSVNALINKLVTSNIGMFTANAFKDWSGYLGWDEPAEDQPKRFYDTLWPVFWLTSAFDHLAAAVGYFFYRYTRQQRDQVEAELAERRALKERIQAGMEAQA